MINKTTYLVKLHAGEARVSNPVNSVNPVGLLPAAAQSLVQLDHTQQLVATGQCQTPFGLK